MATASFLPPFGRDCRRGHLPHHDLSVYRSGARRQHSGRDHALNNIIDITVPLRQEEGGTYVIPVHGRIADRFEVVEYRDMVTIVRDRIRAGMKDGMTVDQIKAAHPTLDYDYRYGAQTGFGTPDTFVEAVYKSLTKGK